MTGLNLTTPPPGKLSDVITLAVADGRKLERQNYTPCWAKGHEPNPRTGKCMIGVTGVVVAGTLTCPAGLRIDPTTPETGGIGNEPWRRALRALELASCGNWIGAVQHFTKEAPDHRLRSKLTELRTPTDREFNDWNEFYVHLEGLEREATKLRELGL